MKIWLKKVSREGARASGGRPVIVTLHPATMTTAAEVEVREKGRRGGYRITFGSLLTALATRAAGLEMQGRRARRGGR